MQHTLRTLQVYTKSGSWHRTMVRPRVDCFVTGCGGGVEGLRGHLAWQVALVVVGLRRRVVLWSASHIVRTD